MKTVRVPGPITNSTDDRWRARAVAGVGWLFLIVGGASVVRASVGLAQGAPPGELWPMLVSGAVAITGGALVLRRLAAGRWLLALWMVLHVVLSALHDRVELAVHLALFTPIAWVLFRPEPRSAARSSDG